VWRHAPITGEEDRRIMNRTDGLLLGGVALVAGAFQRLEDDAVHMTRGQMNLEVQRFVGRTRRLARDVVALIQLAIGVAILVHVLRTAVREWATDGRDGGATVGADGGPVA
jgi:hypothetical protein